LSPLKSLGQINRNLVESIYGRSSINIADLVPIHEQAWLPQAILEINQSETRMTGGGPVY
jgi:hypothetical protein